MIPVFDWPGVVDGDSCNADPIHIVRGVPKRRYKRSKTGIIEIMARRTERRPNIFFIFPTKPPLPISAFEVLSMPEKADNSAKL